jgi:hypothetical protein
MSEPDGLIAATAVFDNLTVVSRNETDFRRAGAKTLNPGFRPQNEASSFAVAAFLRARHFDPAAVPR